MDYIKLKEENIKLKDKYMKYKQKYLENKKKEELPKFVPTYYGFY